MNPELAVSIDLRQRFVVPMSYQVLLYYKYVRLSDPEAYRDEHLALCQQLGLRGRIIVAEEGINGTVSGDLEATEAYMETMRADIGRVSALAMLGAVSLLPGRALLGLFGRPSRPEDTAAILFSSGSEGTPKGIELTHRNIMANVRQISDVSKPACSTMVPPIVKIGSRNAPRPPAWYNGVKIGLTSSSRSCHPMAVL